VRLYGCFFLCSAMIAMGGVLVVVWAWIYGWDRERAEPVGTFFKNTSLFDVKPKRLPARMRRL
jgi:hypothetical protein